MRLRIIGLCEAYGRRQTPGSEAAAHAARMLALYRRHYTRLTGHEPTAAEVAVAMQSRESEMILCNSKRNQQPKPKQSKKCEAKVRIPCPYHDLTNPKDWMPQRARMYAPTEARQLLARKPAVTDPLGNRISFGPHIVQHWRDEGKSEADINDRLSKIGYAIATVKRPSEIWQDDDGTLSYLSCYIEGHKKHIVAFTLRPQNKEIHTVFFAPTDISHHRKGKLLYPNMQDRADASDT